MGFGRHAVPSTDAAGGREAGCTLLREPPVVTPLRPAGASRETGSLRLARQMRGEWRKQGYSRLAGD